MLAALTTLAQDYSYSYNPPTSASDADLPSAVMVPLVIISVALAVIMIAAMWKVFTKAKQPGWAAIVPIYNYYILLKIVGRPTWWLLLLLLGFIPVVGGIATFVISIIVFNDLSKSFGRGTGMTVLLALVPFVGFPILGFGKDVYKGPSVTPPSTPTTPVSSTTPTTPAPTPPATPAA